MYYYHTCSQIMSDPCAEVRTVLSSTVGEPRGVQAMRQVLQPIATQYISTQEVIFSVFYIVEPRRNS